jgi:hypothetical protein
MHCCTELQGVAELSFEQMDDNQADKHVTQGCEWRNEKWETGLYLSREQEIRAVLETHKTHF